MESTGVQSINDAFHIVNKVENVFVYTYIFNLIDNVECVVYALYSRVVGLQNVEDKCNRLVVQWLGFSASNPEGSGFESY
jgi:hypothetical protein